MKTVVVGDSGVGKTSLLTRFVQDTFEEDVPPTLGVEFMSKIITRPNGRRIELQLWDTAGQELFRAVTRGYYRNSIGAFLVYNVTCRVSFENIERWLHDVQSTARENVVTVLVGNQCDRTAARAVSEAEGAQFAADHGMIFFETSAKNGHNVEEAMTSCLEAIEKMIDEGKYDGKIGIDAINVSPQDEKKSCC